MAEEKHELDLPLHSNIEDIRVKHYCLELTCDIQKKIFHGCVVLVIVPVDESSATETEGSASQLSQVEETLGKDDIGCTETANTQGVISVVSNQLYTQVVDYQGGTAMIETQSGLKTVNKLGSMEMIDRKGQTDTLGTLSGTPVFDTSHNTTKAVNSCDTYIQTEAKAKELNQEDKERELTDNGRTQSIEINEAGSEIVINKTNTIVQTSTEETKEGEEETVVYKIKDTESENSNLHARRSTELLDLVSVVKNTVERNNGFIETVCKIAELPDHNYTSLCVENDTKQETITADDFVMVLDSWDLLVTSVHEIDVHNTCCDIHNLGKEDKANLKQVFDECNESPLIFSSEKTCLKFWKPGIKHAQQFPRCIRISYQTKPSGSSLKWTSDQDGRPCVFTHGHWINNRSLFPSQDVPRALATWRAYIHVPNDMTVLMSGDQNPEIRYISDASNLKTYIYHTDLVVPSSTLALAVGCWTEVEIISCLRPRSSSTAKHLPCRLFTPKTHQRLASTLLSSYIPRCMDAAFSVLGSHPFKRLDILIVPSSFASLGMASPSLMFLSQSVLSNDGHMLIRVAHEMSHSWFGLAIGPHDWHEEWLSEGFCTYTESVIHAKANQMMKEEFTEEREIYDHIKLRILEAEIEATSTDLQTLSMKNDGNSLKTDSDIVKSGNRVKYVSNGMNPDKGFLQVHYLKGYFLLRFLEDLVGCSAFLDFLMHLVETFHHMLIDSVDVLGLLFKAFPELRSTELSEETLQRDWLNSPGVPKISGKATFEDNKLTKEVSALVSQVHECNSVWTKMHWRKRRKVEMASYLKIPKLKQAQLLLFLDRLLELKKIHPEVLYHLNKQLGLAVSNADVSHKWCELVIKNRLQDSYNDIKQFLVHHQAMGVYLFGELIISQDGKQRKLAEECFTSIRDDMEEGVEKVVQAMVYGR